jgi:hypothetical protein
MDDVVAWFEEILTLRYAALRTRADEPEYTDYAAAVERHNARCLKDAVDPVLTNRDEDDEEDDLARYKRQGKKLTPMVALAVAHRGGDKYTFVTSSDKARGAGRVPSWEHHVEKIAGEWKLVGISSRSKGGIYCGARHDDPIRETRQLNSDQLREDHADYPGEVEVG